MIAVLDYGIGNLRSAEKAIQAVGAPARLVADPTEAALAEAVVLPGVGAFGSCAAALRASGLEGLARQAAREAIEGGRPFLGICIGMQLLYEGSEEAPGVPGLGVLPGVVRRLPEGVKRPQMQWNRLIPLPSASGDPLLEGVVSESWFYFVHSYAAPEGPEVVAWCDYGGLLPAMVASGRMWATQFHPEKSGAAGLALLERFARCAGGSGVEMGSVPQVARLPGAGGSASAARVPGAGGSANAARVPGAGGSANAARVPRAGGGSAGVSGDPGPGPRARADRSCSGRLEP